MQSNEDQDSDLTVQAGNTLNRLRGWFEYVADLPAAERESWMAANMADPDERAAVRRLLANDEGESGYLDTPAAEHVARLASTEIVAEGLIGKEIGGFRLLRLLGQGGMATVFLGERIGADFQQQAAIKLLRRGLYSELEQRLFQRERQILATLDHPHIARLIDGGVTDTGIPYLVMEFIDGVPITQYVYERVFNVRQRLQIFLDVCRAVEAAHQNLVVHRDIKPSNILVGAHGEVRLLDFGIAKLLDEGVENATGTIGIFTPGYAAPEQMHGGLITTATDVYGLGVLLHELLLGLKPKLTDSEPLRPSSRVDESITLSVANVAASVTHSHTAASSEQLRRALRGDLDNIILKALEADPARRYASAGALADDVERHLGGRPVVAHPPTRWYRTQKFIQRHRGGVTVTAILALAVFAALGIALWQARVARYEARHAKAVNDFLLQIFDAAKANLPSNERPTPELLVREASKRAREDASIAPALRAEFLQTLGEVSSSLGSYAEAESLLDEALRWSDSAGEPATAPDRLAATVSKANVLAITNRNTAAQALLDGVLPALRAQDSDTGVGGLQLYANIEYAQGNYDEAIAFAREAAAKATRVYPADSLEAMHLATFPGIMLAASQRHRESAAELAPLLARWRKLGLAQDMYFAIVLNNLAVAKGYLGDSAGAESLLREGLDLRRRVYAGRPHDRLAGALESLALFLIVRERFDEARALLDEALGIYKTVLGPQSSRVAGCLQSIGLLETGQRRLVEAEAHLREAVTIYATHAKQSGLVDELAVARSDLAVALVERGTPTDAAEQSAAAIAELRNAHGDKIPNATLMKVLLADARVALARDDPAAALDTIARAETAIAAQNSPNSRFEAIGHYLRAQALTRLGRHVEALDEIGKALSEQHKAAPEAHARIASMLALRARIETASGNPTGAAAAIAEAAALGVPVALLSPEDTATLTGRAGQR